MFSEVVMVRAAIVFFVLALISFLFGASGVAGLSMEAGRMLLFVFLILGIASLIARMLMDRGGPTTPRM